MNGIDLTIENGEYVAIIGTSGSGKSTLLNIIGGMDQTTDGQYLYDEKNVSKMNSHALHLFRKEYVSFVFQRFALLNQYSVYENVEVPLLAKGIEKKERKKKFFPHWCRLEFRICIRKSQVNFRVGNNSGVQLPELWLWILLLYLRMNRQVLWIKTQALRLWNF